MKLKNCPFCGSEPWGSFGPDEDGHYWIECHGPGDDCMTCGDWYGTNDYKNLEDVEAAWNTRAAPSQPERAEPVAPEVLGFRMIRSGAWTLLRERSSSSRARPTEDDARMAATIYRVMDRVRSQSAGAAAPDEGEAWTSVERRLPTEGDTVICHAGFTPYLAHLEMKQGRMSGWDEHWSHDGEPEERPTHWMPLPSAPKGEDK